MWVMDKFWIPDPMSLVFLLPLTLSPFLLGRFIPKTVSAPDRHIRISFIIMLISDAVWLTPAGFVAGTDMPDDMKLPEGWDYLSSMPAKLSAILTLVYVTVIVMSACNGTIKQGTILWGRIDFAAQFVLIFLAFTSTWIMGLMGAVRSLLKKYFHVYSLVRTSVPSRLLDTLVFGRVDYGDYRCLSPSSAWLRWWLFGLPLQGTRAEEVRSDRSQVITSVERLLRRRDSYGNIFKKLGIGLVVGGALILVGHGRSCPSHSSCCSSSLH